MIKIDGNKIKLLRESKGFTQLYVATAVEVTTDTISRWENKRYPSIKRENALKLAEALESELDDILLLETEKPSTDKDIESTPQRAKQPRSSKIFIVLFLGLICLIALIIGILHYRGSQLVIQAQRIMPSNTIAGSPFPVVIQVHSSHPEAISLILKETLPENCEIIETSPPVASSAIHTEIKWIQKIKNSARFSYLVRINNQPDSHVTFSGSVAISHGNNTPINVGGSDQVQLGEFHWADSDGNNRIDDQEILNVFDRYSDIDDFKIDVDLIERMWLGESYSWNKDKKHITIIP